MRKYKWTPSALETLQRHLNTKSREEVAQLYNVTPQAITNVAARYGIRITKMTGKNRRFTRDCKGKFANTLKIDTPAQSDPFGRPRV